MAKIGGPGKDGKTGRLHLKTERRALPRTIASLSVEGRNLVETLGQAKGTAHRLLGERIEEIGEQLGGHERRLAEVERALAVLDQTEIEASWVAESLAHFDAVWDAMTIENRGRLVRAIVQKVEVDEAGGQVTAELVELGVGDQALLETRA